MAVGDLNSFQTAVSFGDLPEIKSAVDYLDKLEKLHFGDKNEKVLSGLFRRRLELLSAFRRLLINLPVAEINSASQRFIKTEISHLENLLSESASPLK